MCTYISKTDPIRKQSAERESERCMNEKKSNNRDRRLYVRSRRSSVRREYVLCRSGPGGTRVADGRRYRTSEIAAARRKFRSVWLDWRRRSVNARGEIPWSRGNRRRRVAKLPGDKFYFA